MPLAHPHHLKHTVQLVLAWLFLNLAINSDYPEPTSTLDLLRPSLEIWALLLIVSLLATFKPSPSAWVLVPLIPVVLFLRLFRFGDVLVPVYFSRPFNLYIDSGYVSSLIHLLDHSFARQQLVLYALAAAGLLVAFLWGIHKAFQLALGAFSIPRLRRIFWGLTACLAAWGCLYLNGTYPFNAGLPATTCTPRLLEEAAFILKLGDIKRQWLSSVQAADSRIPHFSEPLDDLKKNDVYLIFIESYGETLFDDKDHAREFVPLVQGFEASLTRAGFAMCSRFLKSPTFGGSSWLAFGTLESGMWLSDELRYDFLLNSQVPPLAAYFNRAGYRTLSVMPGTTMPWPEGRYFQYARTYYAKDLDYRGPAFGWSPMPDQFVVNTVYTREIARRSQPLFIRYMLTSTHAPFNRQPPYLQNWNEIGAGEIYHRLPTVTFAVNWPDMSEAGTAYLASMRYEFTVLQDYLTRFVNDGALILILGDHQPIAHITGSDASTRVPVHVLSRNRALLDPFFRMGYTPGMVPQNGPPLEKGMQDFLADFLTAFSTHGTEKDD